MIKFGRAFAAGLMGAFVAIVVGAGLWGLLRFLGLVRDAPTSATLVEFSTVQLIVVALGAIVGGAILAIIYAFIFEYVTRHGGWLLGAIIGLANAAALWLGAGLLSWFFHPVAELVLSVMSLAFNSAVVVTAFAMVHIVYGAVVGAFYGRTLHAPESRVVVTWRELYPGTKKVD